MVGGGCIISCFVCVTLYNFYFCICMTYPDKKVSNSKMSDRINLNIGIAFSG